MPITSSKQEEFEVMSSSNIAAARWMSEQVAEALDRWNFPQRQLFAARIAVDEALMNALKHGNRMDPEKSIRMVCSITDKKARIEIEDEGAGFRPEEVPDPTCNGHREQPGGRGILLIKAMTSHAEYRESGKRVVLEVARDANGPAASTSETP